MITLLIADDQTLMRDGLTTILGLQDDMHVIGLARNGDEALRMATELQPKIVLMDIQMPILNGIECTKQLKARFPDMIVLILTTFADDDYIIEALAGGATGFLLKDIPGELLARMIRDAVNGQFLLPSAIAARLAARLSAASLTSQAVVGAARARSEGVKLSDKEKEVARAMLEGRTNREIAGALYMSEGTVRNYVSSIYSKLGTNDRKIAIATLRELVGGAE